MSRLPCSAHHALTVSIPSRAERVEGAGEEGEEKGGEGKLHSVLPRHIGGAKHGESDT